MRRFFLIALVVAGCSGASATVAPSRAPTAIPSAASQSSATPSPTAALPMASATPDIKTLASTYLQIAGAANAKMDTCNAAFQSTDLATVKAALGTCIDVYTGMTNGLAAVNWGPVQPKVDDLISADAKVKLVLTEMEGEASIAGMASYNGALQTASGDSVGAIAVLRAALGLPQVAEPS